MYKFKLKTGLVLSSKHSLHGIQVVFFSFFFPKALKIGTISIKQNTHSMPNMRKGSFSMKKMDVHMMISESKNIYIVVKLMVTFLSENFLA